MDTDCAGIVRPEPGKQWRAGGPRCFVGVAFHLRGVVGRAVQLDVVAVVIVADADAVLHRHAVLAAIIGEACHRPHGVVLPIGVIDPRAEEAEAVSDTIGELDAATYITEQGV